MAELFAIRAGDTAEVVRGRYHGFSLQGHLVQVVRQDEEVLGFWWCIWNDNRGYGLVRREILLNESQLQAKGGASA